MIQTIRYVSLILLSVFAACTATAQDASLNYFMAKTMLNSSGTNIVKDIQYYDDLGRATFRSNDGVGMTRTPVFTSRGYDRLGRMNEECLPYLVSAGEEDRYYQYHYDGLGRVTFTDSPGTDWKDNDKGVGVVYGTNAANDVKRYKAPLGSTSLVQDGYYASHTLRMEKTTDEDGHTLSVFTDLLGRKVLERRGEGIDTYYVYNDKDQLRFVLTPEYQKYDHRDLFAYEYRYDGRGRLEKRLLPQCGTEQYYYDDDDHLIYWQDANGHLFFCLYDSLGHPAVKEDALPLTYAGAFDFVSKTIPTSGVQYAYYDDGSLKWDANKGIIIQNGRKVVVK